MIYYSFLHEVFNTNSNMSQYTDKVSFSELTIYYPSVKLKSFINYYTNVYHASTFCYIFALRRNDICLSIWP